jgi:aquaglyceroporin related protein
MQIPMVAPFFGCAFGGCLYDVFIFTGKDSIYPEDPLKTNVLLGESPINTPWMGIKRLFRPGQVRKTMEARSRV